jgi:hypothetical protein
VTVTIKGEGNLKYEVITKTSRGILILESPTGARRDVPLARCAVVGDGVLPGTVEPTGGQG